ncbi:hypothetical protein CCS41_13885 (plasmid) [Candidatus Fukatsuia symbiotica]|uniref:Carrier domain-containing protein n=1 Tax=Candidatus Fukatsuia symbiotica TaxID=1878942 RepID=A0A2U8I8I8_9GAMM|nr:non-ribosomal peptide synthetase [Candidatus Fukatsuia symbiotica]AWK15516.1 hypothetical protein CCS41_13885 [Candidatus Fukatsuia symbiotica]
MDHAYTDLRLVVFGGEVLEPDSLKPWYARHGDRVRLVNMYGITETTVHVTEKTLAAAGVEQATSVIGEPLKDLSLQVLDRYGEPVPTGVAGEIYVGGAGVTRGYLGRAALTAQRFVPDPYGPPGARLYRSGDVARQLPDGGLVYLGRADRQIKLRGFRIEPGEVEAALRAQEGVQDAVVMLNTPAQGAPRLVAYVTGAVEPLALHGGLSQRLPGHMVPALIMPLECFPLTDHGKLDCKALPKPVGNNDLYVEPRTPEQKALATIWQEVLGTERVGINDNYFALGGDSIRSIRIVSQAEAKGIRLSIEDLFQKLTIERLTEDLVAPVLARREPEAFALLVEEDRWAAPADAVDGYPLSELQAGMLFHAGYGDGRQLYHDIFSYRLEIALDPKCVRQRLRQLFAAHPVLRTSFALSGYSRPVQWVHAKVEPSMVVEDLLGLCAAARSTAVGRAQERLRDELFDPATPPLLRLLLQRLEENQWQVSFAIHHVILDGWSVASLLADMLRVEAPVPARDHVFRNFVALELQALRSEEERVFWQRQLQDMPVTSLTRWPLETVQQGRARSCTHESHFPPVLYQALAELARRQGSTLKSVLLALHARVLAHWSGEREVVTGLVTNGRPEEKHGAEALGLFLNTLPIRLETRHARWTALLEAVRQAEGAQLAHRRFPMAELRRLHRSSSLFETTFNFVDFHVYQDVVSKGGDLTARILEVSSVQSFDIPMGTSFTVDRDQGLLHLTLSYDAALFPPAQAQAIAATYLRAAEALVSGSDEAYAGLVLASTQELTDIELRGQGRSARAQPPSVIQAVRAAACRRPWALAVQSIAGDLDYATLDRRSSELATHLLAAGLQPDRPVALLLNRSPEMVIAMLAVLKAACPYVPLVAGLPARRLTEIFEDVRPQATLILNALRSELPTQAESGRLLIVDALPELPQPPPLSEPHEATLAYVLFTSGSTGRPKGISIPVKALANHMAWMQRCFPLAEDDRVLQKTSVGFDASIWEFWAPLMAGATLVLAEESVQRDANALLETIQMRAITVLQLVPSVLDILLELSELADCKSLRRVFVGGEALQASTIGRFEAVLGLPLINLYGPTEATIDSSYASYRGNEGAAVSIGEPIDGASLYVFDDRLQPVGLGIYGELWIGGIGLARGYWRRAAETAASFLPDHISAQPGSRMYRTGDIVRWLPDGGLQYAGRRDSQIKLRGNRIELTEIEAALARQPGVTRSAVLARKDARGQVQLVAYVLGQGAPAQKFILSSLSLFLPDYMLPQRIVRITTWPLTPNGKTDYGALPASEPPTDRAESVASQPANQLELELTTVWSKLLASSKIGVTDNFFELGGDSILAMQIAAEMRRRGYVMVPRQLFEQPTVRALAAVLTPPQATTTPALEAPIGPLPLSPSQRWFFDLELSKRAHWNQAVMLRVPSQLQPHRLHKALSAVVAVHDAFRLRFSPVGDGWVQRLAVDAGDWYASVDFSGLAVGERGAALTALAEQAQRSLELGHGPLLKAVHVDYGLGEAGFLLLVIHHLIVDGVSWRVLLYDLNLTLDGHNVQPPTVGFGPWLAAQAECAVAEQVRAYWLKQAEYVAVMGRVPRSGQVAPEGRYGQAQTIEQLFDREATLRLLGEAQMRLKARPVELLLTAVAGALRGWAYNGRLAVTMEGHGRDNGYEWQLERTVGWFTVLYPLVCELEGTADGPATLLRIKKALRSVPDGGVGYGRLRAQGILGQLPLPEISFNYLGQFEDDGADGSLTVVAESVGDSEDPEGRRPHVLDIVALIQAGQLRLRWVFDDRAPERATIAVLAATAAERLRELLTSENVCSAWGADDFPLAGVDTKSLPLALGEHGQQLVDLWKTTPTQEGMLFHSRLEGDTSAVYLEQVVVQLYGDIDANLLARAWNEVAARHDALRSAFVWEGLGRPLQRIWRSVEVPFEEVELDEGTDNDVLDAFLERDRRRGLTLTIAPLMRISLLRRCRRAWRLVWTHHHAVLDGWSMALVFAELAKCYQALTHGETSPMVSAPSYGDYVRWLEQMPREQISERFWSDYLNGLDTVSLFGREPQKTSMHDWLSMSLPLSQVERLHTLAARYQVTLNTLVQSAYAVALSRLSGHRKVVFGVTVSGRPSELMEVERMVGLFIITLPMLVDCAGDVSIGDLFGRVQATQGAIEHHAFVRAVDIQRWSGLAADQPLFDSVLVYENYPIDRSLADLSHNLGIGTVVARDHPHYAFSLYVKPSASELVLEAVFDPQRVERSRADLMLGGVRYLLKQLADGIGHVGALQLAELPPATALETRTVDPDILALIRHMAETGPGRRAVSAPDRNLSYSELLTVSRAFAAQLLDHGVRPGMCVAIGLGRSADMLVALLGVLWAGAQYVPVDPALPAIRRTMILQDAIPHLVLVDAATEPAFAGHPLLHYAVGDRAVAALPGDTLPPRALAYTIFTSGSTGRPKGVQINHGALANILIHFRTTPGLSAEDRLLAVTTLSFDIAALELFLPLCCGSEVVIASTEDAANGRALGDIIARHQISVMQATPASWRLLLAADWRPPKGFRAWCGGEALPLELTRDLLSLGIELWNVYGPTETTIWSAVSKVEAPLAMPLPVGGPIRGTALYVLDADGQRLPEGVNGQLAIGGDGLATGYLRDPRQTAKYFRPDPFSGRDGDRLYLTGDLARTRRDGSFEVVGRFDNQVKLNGFRIELGDVEAALRTLHGVRNAAVVVHTSAGYEHLVAYLEPTNDAPDDSTWREALVASLPRYMLPAQLIRLQALPLTPNGKLDRRTLPKPDLAEHSAAKLEPVGAVETAMCAIWSEVFMIEEISVDDDFYALGGHSLLATQIHTRLVRIFRISLPLGEVFRATTPRALAAVVDAYADPAWATKIAKAYLHLLSLSPNNKRHCATTTVCHPRKPLHEMEKRYRYRHWRR